MYTESIIPTNKTVKEEVMNLRVLIMAVFLIVSACTPETTRAQTGSQLRFKRHTITDSTGFGYPVFQILVPEGWQFSGQVQWTSTMGLPQGFLTYQATAPDGQAQVQRFPEQVYHWTDNPTLLNGYRMNGAATAPPMDATRFVQEMVLPSLGKSGARIVQTTPMPQLAEQSRRLQEMLLNQVYMPISPLPAPPQMEGEAALVLTQLGNASEQYLVVINRVYTTQPSMYGPIASVSWTVELTAYRTPGKTDSTTQTAFQTMIRSATISPRWAVDCTRLIATCTRNMLRQQHQIHQAMRQIGQTQSEISDMIMDGWEKRNAVMDGVHDRFSDYMRGSDPYHDPIQGLEIDVPNQYENAWTNGLDYVFSDDPSFNPNRTASTQNWTQMQRVR